VAARSVGKAAGLGTSQGDYSCGNGRPQHGENFAILVL
jgi:hypothetical protein